MYPVSNAFLETLRAPSMVAASKVVTGTGIVLSIESGAVSMDSRRNIGRTCDLDLLPTADLSLQDVYDLVMSPAVELMVYRGLVVNGTVEYVPLGVFSTDTATLPKVASGRVRWSGSDRSKKVARARFTNPYQILSGTTLATAGTQLLQSRLNDVQCNFSNVLDVMTAGVIFEAGESSDPWASARDLFADYGYDLNFDGEGVARATSIPDPATQEPAFDFGSGDTNLVTGGDINGSFEGVYNGVIASGEGSAVATPVRAEVWDTDPNSPTYYLGGFGLAPYFFSSPLLTTVDMCNTAAQILLAKVKGRSQQLSWPAVVNPALEPLDVVTVTYSGTVSTCVLDKVTIPLRATDAMSAVAREVTIA